MRDGSKELKPFLIVLLLAVAVCSAPFLHSEEIALWPKGSQVLKDGKMVIRAQPEAVENPSLVITHPSYLTYLPKSKKPTPAVLIFPGGGFKAVAIGRSSTLGHNGVDVARWLNAQGIACFVVKYRVPNTACNWNAVTGKHTSPPIPMAFQDAQRVISQVRYHAKRYNLDPNKIGVMGFSAGGNLAALTSTGFERRAYAPVDHIDRTSCRPDFAVLVYPGHLTMEHKNKTPKAVAAQELNSDIKISKNTPPTLLVHAKDDPVDPVHYSEVYERELRKAGVSVQLNLYETGGHAFGVRRTGQDTDRWQSEAIRWLKAITEDSR